MATTEKHIFTHHLTTVSMKEVRNLLPPNHRIREFDETFTHGRLAAGDYFVTILDIIYSKTTRGETSLMPLKLIPVLQDGTREKWSMDCYMYGFYCKAVEDILSLDVESQGPWHAENDKKELWIVLHRASAISSKKPRKDAHPLMLVVGPKTGPNCQMWLLLKSSSAESQSSQNSDSLSPSLIESTPLSPSPVPLSPPPPPPRASIPPQPPPTTVVALDIQTSSSNSVSSTLSNKRPTSSSSQDCSASVSKGTATAMATTEKHIISHHLTTVSMKEVRNLLPPNHRIREFDETITQGRQAAGDYFVIKLIRFCGNKKIGNTCRVLLKLFPVLQDGTRLKRIVDCFMYGPYCQALEDMLSTNLESQGTWSANGAKKDNVVWIVLHRAFVVPSRLLRKKLHPFSLVVGPETSPDCQVWLLMGSSSAVPGTSLVSSPSSSVIDDASLPPSPSPSPSPSDNVSIVSDVQHSSPSSNLSISSTSSTQAPVICSSNTEKICKATTADQSSDPECAPAACVHSMKSKRAYILKPLSAGVADCRISTAAVLVEVVKMGELTKNGKITFDILKIADKTCTEPSAVQTHMMVKVFHNDGMDWLEDGKPQVGQVLVFKDMMCKLFRGHLEGIIYTAKMVCVCTQDEDKQLKWYCHSQNSPDNIENAEKIVLELFEWWAEEGSTFRFGMHNVQLNPRAAAVLPTCNISQAGGKGLFTLYCKVLKKTLYTSPVRPAAVLRVFDGTCTSYQFEKVNYNPSEVEERRLEFDNVSSMEVDIMVKGRKVLPELENLQIDTYVRLQGLDCVVLPEGCRRLIFELDDDEKHIKVLEEDDPEIQPIKSRVEQLAAEMRAEDIADENGSMNSEEMDDDDAGLAAPDSPAACSVSPSPRPDLHADSFEAFIRQNESPKKLPVDRDSPSSKRRHLNFTSPHKKLPVDRDSPPSEQQHITSPHKNLPVDRDSPPRKRQRLKLQALFPFLPTLQSSSSSSSSIQPPHLSPQSHTSKIVPSPQSPQQQTIYTTTPQPSTSRQPVHPSSPHPPSPKHRLHPSSPPPPSPKHRLHPSSPHPPSPKHTLHPSPTKVQTGRQSQQHILPQVSSHTSSTVSTTHDSALQELQQADSADTPVPGALQTTTQLKFHAEVGGEAKKSSSLDTFFQARVGELHCVEVVITDIRIIAVDHCWCKEADYPCVHQWVWGLCDKCGKVFSSRYLAKVYSSLTLTELDSLLCKSCMHEHATHTNAQAVEGDGEEQPQGTAPQFLGAVLKPFIKIKLEVEDPTTHFQMTPWLTGDDATLFFGMEPSFKWITEGKKELQRRIGALLEQNSTLTLGMMKKPVVIGGSNSHIVNTVLHCSHSRPKTPNSQPANPVHIPLAIYPLPQSSCPEPSLANPVNPQPPTSPPDPSHPPTHPSDPQPPTGPSDPSHPTSPSDPHLPTSPPHS